MATNLTIDYLTFFTFVHQKIKTMCKSNFYSLSDKALPNYFKFSELICTNKSINNYPLGSLELSNLSRLWYILNRIRHWFGSPIFVNSAYRCPSLNAVIPGSSVNSRHMLGTAADIRTLPHLMEKLRTYLVEIRELHPDLFVEFIDHDTYFHIAIL